MFILQVVVSVHLCSRTDAFVTSPSSSRQAPATSRDCVDFADFPKSAEMSSPVKQSFLLQMHHSKDCDGNGDGEGDGNGNDNGNIPISAITTSRRRFMQTASTVMLVALLGARNCEAILIDLNHANFQIFTKTQYFKTIQ